MSNLAYTDAIWKRFMRELGLWLRAGRTIEERRRRYTRERVQVRNFGDLTSATPHLTAVVISTLGEFGTSTSEEGRLYVRFVANAGNWDVHLYRSTGAANEVGTVTNVAASATGTIVEANSSGLTGTLTLGAAIAGDTSDSHQLLILPDWKRESLLIFPSDGTTDNDVHSRTAFEGFLADAARQQVSLLSRWRSRLGQWALSAPGNPVARGGEFLKEAQGSLLTEAPNPDNSGAVTRDLTGFFPVIKQAMADEATGSTQDILQRVVAMAAATFGSNNTGSGAVSTPTPDDRAPLGTWLLKCIRGQGNGFGGREEFSLEFTGTDTNDDTTFADTARLVIKQSYTLPGGGGSTTLTRVFTKTGDGGHADVGAASTFSLSGENETNTSAGVLYVTIVANGSNWDIKFYNTSTRNIGDLVAQATNVATSASSVQATARNGSNLTVTFDVGSGPTDTNTLTIDANYFSVENSAKVPDEFRMASSLTSEGKASRVIAFLLNAELNGIAAGPQIDDDLLAGANTDLNFITADF